MRRTLWILTLLVGLLSVLVLAVVLISVAVSQGWQRERLRAFVEAQLAQSLDAPVSLGGISGPLIPHLELQELRIGPPDAPTLRVDELTAGIAWRRTLASRSPVLRSLRIRGLALALERDDSGEWQIPDWLGGDAEEGPDADASTDEEGTPALRVHRTTLEQASLHVRWHEGDEPAAILFSGSATLGPWSLPPAPGVPLRAELALQGRSEGAARRWLEEAELEASLDGSRLALASFRATGGETPPLTLAKPATLVIEGDRVRTEGLELTSDRQQLRLAGGISTEGFDELRASVRELDVTLAGRLLGGGVRPGGRVSGEMALDGPFTRPDGRVDLRFREPSLGSGPEAWSAESVELRASGDGREIRLEELAVDGVPGGPLRLARTARLRIREDAVEIHDVELRSAAQALVANGTITSEAFRDLEIELRNLDVALWGRLLGLAAEPGGALFGQLALDGRFERPQGQVTLDWQAPRLAGEEAEALELRAEMDQETARLDATLHRAAREPVVLEASLPARELIRAFEPGSDVRARGQLPDALRARLHGDALALADLEPWLPEAARRLDATLAFDLTLRGGAKPTLAGRAALRDGVLAVPGQAPIEPVRAELVLLPDPGTLAIDRLRVDAPGFSIDARGTLTADAPSALALSLDAPDLEVLGEALELHTPLVGSLHVDAELSGTWPRPSIRGDARWTNTAPDALSPHRGELVVSTEDGQLRGDLAIHQTQRLAAEGELLLPYPEGGLPALADAARDARLVLRAEDFDLASTSPLLPRLVRDLRGRVDASLTMRPGEERLLISGDLQLRDGSLRVPALRQTFAPVDGSISLRENVVRVETLRIGEPGHHADVSGMVRLDETLQPARFDLALSLEALPLARSRALTTDVSGSLLLTGPVEHLQIEGEVALSDASVRLVETGDPALREFEVVTSDVERRGRLDMQERPEPPGIFERASVDVELTVPRNTWVRGRGADIDLAGTLRVEKAPGQDVRLAGRVATVRGTYRFQGKRFELRRGSVSFAGSSEIDPMLDIEAVHRVRDVTIVILLSGSASEPVVTLTSEPPLPEDDVLSYLFFGRPTEELGTRQPTGDLDQAATAFAAGVALQQASRLVEDNLFIDTIDVAIDEEGTSGDLALGKYVTDDLFIRYERGFGKDAVDGVRLELRLTDHWSVETEASTDESAGADLVWSFDY